MKPSIKTLRGLLSYDPETGALTWKERDRKWFDRDQDWRRWNNRFAGKAAGSLTPRGYLTVRLGSKLGLAHRLAWAIHYGRWPKQDVDHINGVRSDNRISNLRDVSRSVNLQNQRQASRGSQTGLLGVTPSGTSSRHRSGSTAESNISASSPRQR